ncbi:hypothetical protein BH20CHL4_BH20CHL4_09760 [soil metagenome]
MTTGEDVKSASLPGGSLLSAVLDKQVMMLADRGNASALIGSLWANLAASHADQLVGTSVAIPGAGRVHIVERVVRLDDDERIASRAARNGLQNPDLVFFGRLDGKATVQAVDAKFSVETARSKQVSIEMMQGLIGLGLFFDQAVGGLDPGASLLPGLFLSPDSAFTRYVIRRGRGIIRLTIGDDEMLLIDVSSSAMFGAVEGRDLMEVLFRIDRHTAHPQENLLAGVYYFRLARSAIAMWTDQKKPLLAFNDRVEVDTASVADEMSRHARSATNARAAILDWSVEAEQVNRQRAAVERVSGLPVTGKDLWEWVQQEAAALNSEPPSMNQVRRRLGAWFRGELRARLGPVYPPQGDFPATLMEIGRESRAISSQTRPKTAEIVRELLANRQSADDDVGPAPNSLTAGDLR